VSAYIHDEVTFDHGRRFTCKPDLFNAGVRTAVGRRYLGEPRGWETLRQGDEEKSRHDVWISPNFREMESIRRSSERNWIR